MLEKLRLMTRNVSSTRRLESSVRRLIEVVAAGDLVIEQRDVLIERLFVELLLVEGPAELVEGELVELRHGTARGDGAVRLFGVEVATAREEILGAAKLNFVDVARPGVRGDQLVDHLDGAVGLAELVPGRAF